MSHMADRFDDKSKTETEIDECEVVKKTTTNDENKGE